MDKKPVKNSDNSNHENTAPNRDEVQKMVAEAKFDVARWLITILLALFALLGIVYPWIQSSKQETRVSNSIADMETKFKEMAGKQLRKPKIICRNGNELLLNNLLEAHNNETVLIDIHNRGDGLAGPIDAYLYLKDPNRILNVGFYSGSRERVPSDEKDYSGKYFLGGCDHISPQDYFTIRLDFQCYTPDAKEFKSLLKVYCGEPEPIQVPFTIGMKKSN